MRYLGIDFGSRRVGVALSDEAGRMGFPHAIVPNDGRLIDAIRDIIKRKEVGVVVIGKSLNLDGSENAIADKAKTFARQLELSTDVDVTVEWQSEVYSTQEARRDPEGVHMGNRETVDAAAASIILTSYLDQKNQK